MNLQKTGTRVPVFVLYNTVKNYLSDKTYFNHTLSCSSHKIFESDDFSIYTAKTKTQFKNSLLTKINCCIDF